MDHIQTNRLHLLRMHDTTPNSRHIQLLHKLWSDKAIMAWSLHGPTSTMQESREWLIELLNEYKLLIYVVFVKDAYGAKEVDGNGNRDRDEDEPGELIGYMSLGSKEATLPPPPPPLSSSESNRNDEKSVVVRSLGYSYRERAWGKGYATEAAKGLLDAYTLSIVERKKTGKEEFYVEATWGRKNPASGRVLTKLGMKEVGWKEEEEGAFLNGEWQEPGYWVYGMYV